MVSVPIAERLGLGSVLGYLVAGVMVGPAVLGLVSGAEDVMHVAEFGVVMMLFLVGLELQPSKLWAMRGAVFGLGGAQVVATAAAVALAAVAAGLGLAPAFAVGLILAMSSTAMVLQALAEKGLLKSPAGETSFAVLLFQDIAVIPILAVMPLLAPGGGGGDHGAGAHADGGTLVDGLPGWAAALLVLAAVGVIVLGGRLVMRPLFMAMARLRMREIFTATALLLVAGTALIMESVGLSPALGAFLAGVVLADSEFRHEIETDIAPFKGLLLGLFFIAVGAGIQIDLILARPLAVAAIVLAVVAIKAAVLYAIARSARLNRSDALLTAIALSQIGEFAFVLIGFASQNRILAGDLAALLTASVALSMLTTPILLILFERFASGAETADDRPADAIDERNRVIIAGFGRVGQIVGRLLIGRGVPVTVLEHDAEQLEALRRFGFKLYYGDARRHDLLEAAGAAEAALLVVATDDKETTTEIVETARRNFPGLKIVARAYDRPHAYEVEEAGADRVVRETFEGGIEMATESLRVLGVPAFEANRLGRIFRRHDIETMDVLRVVRKTGDRDAYGLAFRQRREMLSSVLTRDVQTVPGTDDSGWDAETLRRESRGEG
ncbi:potassium transporter [Oharaeibacter diazotrophicus]|nr:potassium transporter [Oharaeibacter diazotrophicus]